MSKGHTKPKLSKNSQSPGKTEVHMNYQRENGFWITQTSAEILPVLLAAVYNLGRLCNLSVLLYLSLKCRQSYVPSWAAVKVRRDHTCRTHTQDCSCSAANRLWKPWINTDDTCLRRGSCNQLAIHSLLLTRGHPQGKEKEAETWSNLLVNQDCWEEEALSLKSLAGHPARNNLLVNRTQDP